MRRTLVVLGIASCAHPTAPVARAPTSAASAWSALAARSFYVRGGAECHHLTATSAGRVARAADPAHRRPRLTFEVAAQPDGSAELRSVPPTAPPPDKTIIGCRITLTSARDIPIGVAFQVPPPRSSSTVPEMPGELVAISDERACLAEPAPDGRTIDCLRSVLDSTSELPDAVVDRLASVPALHRTKNTQCETLPLRTGGGVDVRYTGYSYEVAWWNADERNVESAAVVQTAADSVLLGGQPAYVDRCR